MSSISQVAEAMQRVLKGSAKELERKTGFVQRSTAQLDGPTFVQTTVFGWMDQPEASYSQLRHVAGSLGVQVSSQAMEQRFGPESAALLRAVLQEAVGEVLCSQANVPEVLSRFNGVYVQDGTIISLPSELRQEWEGCGGRTPEVGQSSLRVQVRLDLAQGGMQGPWLQAGREAERSGEAKAAPLPPGSLFDVDTGYFTLAEMRAHRQAGAKRQRRRTQRKTGKARMQLLGWTILITNVPQELLSLDEGLVLARCRWQIELLWKLWKQVGKLDTWRSAKPYRILTEIYAKLLGLLISHWLTLLECWHAPNRSLVKAHQVVQWMTSALALGVGGVVPLPLMVQRTSQAMASGCTVNARRKKPATYQLVDRPKLIRGLG